MSYDAFTWAIKHPEICSQCMKRWATHQVRWQAWTVGLCDVCFEERNKVRPMRRLRREEDAAE